MLDVIEVVELQPARKLPKILSWIFVVRIGIGAFYVNDPDIRDVLLPVGVQIF